jgi:hypothetical protein
MLLIVSRTKPSYSSIYSISVTQATIYLSMFPELCFGMRAGSLAGIQVRNMALELEGFGETAGSIVIDCTASTPCFRRAR